MNDGPVFYLFTSRFNSAYQLLTFDGHFDAVIPPSLLELRYERGLTVVPLHKGIWDTGSGYEIFAGEEKSLCCIEGLTLEYYRLLQGFFEASLMGCTCSGRLWKL